MPDELLKQLSADLGISELSHEEQQNIISQFGEIALKATTVAILEKLPEDKRAPFTEITQSGDVEKLTEFLNRELPNHEEIAHEAVAEEVRRFREFQGA